MTAFDMKDRYRTMTEVIADLESLKVGGAPTSVSVGGIEPVAAGRSDDSAMQSFLNHLDDGTAVVDQTVLTSPKPAAAAPETMASSVGDVTRPAIKKTTALTAVFKEPKNRKLVMGGIVAVAVAIAAMGWGLFGGGGGDNSTSSTNVASRGSNLPGTAPGG
jgi:hypothetical protein